MQYTYRYYASGWRWLNVIKKNLSFTDTFSLMLLLNKKLQKFK